jgi:hypothetical protein
MASDLATRVKLGNLEDDFDAIARADWIVEAIIENLNLRSLVSLFGKHKSTLLRRDFQSRIPNSSLCGPIWAFYFMERFSRGKG